MLWNRIRCSAIPKYMFNTKQAGYLLKYSCIQMTILNTITKTLIEFSREPIKIYIKLSPMNKRAIKLEVKGNMVCLSG